MNVSAKDQVGGAWQEHLGGQGYPAARDLRFLNRFRASAYIQLVVRYAKLPAGSLVLEPGCGSGKFSLALASLGYRVITLDYVAAVLSEVGESSRWLGGRWGAGPAGYCLGSLEKLPFADNSFDLTINEGVVEHWLDAEARRHVFGEMARVTRPGGVVAIFVPNGVHPLLAQWDNHFYRQAPPMTYFSSGRLAAEMAHIGLRDIQSDGIYPWRSWTRLPPWNRLYRLAALLDHVGWLPRPVRQKWAINLIALGRK